MCNVLRFWSKLKARGGIKSNNRHFSWLYCTVVGLSEAATRGVLRRKLLKNFAILKRNNCDGVSFKKSRSCNFTKKRLQHRCFPVNIAIFLKLPILKNICKWQLSIVSMVHCYIGIKFQDLDCMTLSNFRVQIPGLVLCFQVDIYHPEPGPNLHSKTKYKYHWWLSFYVGYFWSL